MPVITNIYLILRIYIVVVLKLRVERLEGPGIHCAIATEPPQSSLAIFQHRPTQM
jgi:hypothetical protein